MNGKYDDGDGTSSPSKTSGQKHLQTLIQSMIQGIKMDYLNYLASPKAISVISSMSSSVFPIISLKSKVIFSTPECNNECNNEWTWSNSLPRRRLLPWCNTAVCPPDTSIRGVEIDDIVGYLNSEQLSVLFQCFIMFSVWKKVLLKEIDFLQGRCKKWSFRRSSRTLSCGMWLRGRLPKQHSWWSVMF